ncbi:MAG TPA: D-glycero-beta-D-manno-heptose 1-phosphate adenylyltransferase [Parafilimonas sp.]|jgi:D-glycero-beta-D-manno-heptose 1-phosphate adenylyltransferase|nr:D-glycero-beta-D-manno-heptose 1-phosphate adenylyltransferase [Parafilimonas sp.]
MKTITAVEQKILSPEKLDAWLRSKRLTSKTIAFTNGCFDILHEGHIFSLSQAAKEADCLIVGVNSDASVTRLKGEHRPINNQHSRSLVLASLLIVDAVIAFDEDTPLELIKKVVPDVLVKGGDYTIDTTVGAKEVMANGGRVVINPIIPGFSTSGLIEKIKSL